MNILFYIFAGILGLLIGSFLNVLILRFNTGKGLGGRSMCFSCKTELRAVDLVPVLSYLWHDGRCRTCKSKISKQYVIVELLTAALFMIAWYHNAPLFGLGDISLAPGVVDQVMWPLFTFGLSSFPLQIAFLKLLVDFLIMSILVFMAVYDLRHKIIPDISVFLFAVCAFIGHLIVGTMTWNVFFAGFVLALPFYAIWLLSRGAWMGLGDAKLAIGIGWMFGLSLGGSAIIFGFWIGALISIMLLLLQKVMAVDVVRRMLHKLHIPRLGLRSEVPFAPFLIAGFLIAYVWGFNVFAFTL